MRQAGQGAGGADADHDRIELVAGLLPDLGAGGGFVGARVGRVVELVGEPGAGDLARQARGIVLVVLGMALADVRAGQVDLGAQGFQVQDFFGRHLVGHDQHHAVALDARHQRQAQAGIAGGGLDHGAAGLQAAVVLGLLDHGAADAVLDRAAGVLRFQFQKQLARTGVHARDLHQRGVADQGEDGCLRRMLQCALHDCLQRRRLVGAANAISGRRWAPGHVKKTWYGGSARWFELARVVTAH